VGKKAGLPKREERKKKQGEEGKEGRKTRMSGEKVGGRGAAKPPWQLGGVYTQKGGEKRVARCRAIEGPRTHGMQLEEGQGLCGSRRALSEPEG